MQKDIRLHGHLGNGIEYFVLVVGTEAYQRYFFNIVQEHGELRIFSPGNEFVLGPHGVPMKAMAAISASICSGWNSPPRICQNQTSSTGW